MGIKDDGIPAADHRDGIVDDGFRWIGGGDDRADHAMRCAFGQHQAVVAALRPGLQHLRPRRLHDDQQILLDLVFSAPEARLFGRGNGEFLHVHRRRFAHRLDQPVAKGEGTLPHLFERAACFRHGLVDHRIVSCWDTRITHEVHTL
jgi:hypothetical protein